MRATAIAVAAGALIAAAGFAGCGGTPGPPTVSVAGSLTTVLLDQPNPAGTTSTARLRAARNEFESFQVIVDAPGGLDGVSIAASGDLTGPGGATIPRADLTTYREVGYPVGFGGGLPSDIESRQADWPDALIPARDTLYGERRDAFPFDIAGGGKLVAWVDVFVPHDQSPGTYRGSVSVRDSKGPLKKVPVSLRVLPFALPSTPSLPSAFGVDWKSICQAQTGSPDCGGNRAQAWLLTSLYTRIALDDRVTLSDPFALQSDQAPVRPLDRSLLDRYIAPLIDGTAAGLRLRGARLTSVYVSGACAAPRPKNFGCLPAWRQIARHLHFSRRFFLYLCDEPGSDAAIWSRCGQTARLGAEQWPGVRMLITASIQEAEASGNGPGAPNSVLDRLGILVPIVNDMANRAGTEYAGDQRALYDSFIPGPPGTPDPPGRELWLYTSCQSYGCAGDRSPPEVWEGWPGYAIDQPASESRAVSWMAFEYRAPGELYYQTTGSLPSAWTDSYEFGGNGSGTLFYPGIPDGANGIPAIGGSRPIPIESIRLKRIRDGREDYEYLHLLSSLGGRLQARRIVKSLFGPPDTAMYSTNVSQDSLERARARVARAILRRSS